MYCQTCGNFVADGMRFCSKCGSPVGGVPAQPVQSQQVAPIDPSAESQKEAVFGASNYVSPATPSVSAVSQPEFGMKWYKFLIYFALFFGAVLNALYGIMALTGAQYGGEAAFVYSMIDGLQAADIFFGIACIAQAVYMIAVRFALAGYRRIAPAMLVANYIIGAVISLLYLLAVYMIADQALSDYGVSADSLGLASELPSVFSSVVWAAVNQSYFKKRQHLFQR